MGTSKNTPEARVREIKRKARRIYNSEEKIRIILEGLRGEDSVAEICRKEGIHLSQYYKWSKEFLEACGELRGVFDRGVDAFRDKSVMSFDPRTIDHVTVIRNVVPEGQQTVRVTRSQAG